VVEGDGCELYEDVFACCERGALLSGGSTILYDWRESINSVDYT
jgi:hypothetical protein